MVVDFVCTLRYDSLTLCHFSLVGCTFSYEPSKRSEDVFKDHSRYDVETSDRSVTERWFRWPGSHQRLHKLTTASFQKAWLQELPEHLPSFCHAASVKYPVSKSAFSALVNLYVSRRRAKSFFCHVLKARHNWRRPQSPVLQFRWYCESFQVFPVSMSPFSSSSSAFSFTHVTVFAGLFLFRDHKMALIQMTTIEEAIQCLIDLHNYNMGNNHHLKVSFSKSTI